MLASFTSEFRLVLSGLHHNLASSRVLDPMLQHTVAALDWLCYGEELSVRVSSSGVYALSKYVAMAGVGIHLHLSCEHKMKVTWPHADAVARSARDARHNIVTTFIQGRAGVPTPPGVLRGEMGSPIASGGSGGLSSSVLVLDVLSPILTILTPPLRAVNFSLHNSVERATAASLVQVRPHIRCLVRRA
jgi:hypothetical protein